MKLIALSCYLKMKPKFFDGLLTKINFTWTKDIFTNVYWSRTFFNFEVLEKICNIMKCPLYVKVYALLSWVQNGINKEIISVSELGNKDEYKKYTTDCYLVRNYMSKNKLSEKMEFSSTKEIFTNFNDNLLALDCKPIINDFMYFGDKKLNCLACDKEFSSLGMVIDNITCKGKSYHPVINKNEKECLHNNCTFKYKEGYYSCCHKVVNTENSKKGCVYAEGKHLFIFN